MDLGLHDTYYVVAHVHCVLALGAKTAIFSRIIFNGEHIVGICWYEQLIAFIPSHSLSLSLPLSLCHCNLIFMAIILGFSPMHLLGFHVMPRRIPSFTDSVHSPTDQGGFWEGAGSMYLYMEAKAYAALLECRWYTRVPVFK